jgi:hypothetical protein
VKVPLARPNISSDNRVFQPLQMASWSSGLSRGGGLQTHFAPWNFSPFMLEAVRNKY